ncbi:glycosyltransferase family 2 protein [Candidatus Gottesmanbacteria bacterium]|nr:glycosyltransferase family 2 protein [Candidatus Gottesmanbacteria bacterium]
MKLPTISVVVATYNSSRTIERCLGSVRMQDYPPRLVDIIVCDGGSTDPTRALVKKFNVSIIAVDPKLQSAEYNKSLGVAKARGDILFLLDHDNVIPHSGWLTRMVAPFIKDKKIVGVETLRYLYDPSTSLLDRYFALFGAGDPLAFYLGKADRLSYLFDKYVLYGRSVDCGDYYQVTFDPDHIPTLGANGFFVRRKLLMEHAHAKPGEFFHIDVNVDLIRKGFNRYAFVKDAILHLTGYNSVWHFLARRVLFMEQFHLGGKGLAARRVRRYSVYESADTGKLIWFIIISLTFVVPLAHSIRGYRKIHDVAWFLHPFLSIAVVVLYTLTILRYITRAYAKRLLDR